MRLYSVVAKVYVPDAALMPARSVLKTHCIAFVHDAPKLISKELFSKNREQDMLDAVQIVLLGPRCKLTTLERKALFSRNFALRPHVLFNFLTLRNVLGGENFDLPKFAEVVEWTSGVEEGLWKRLRHIRDDSVEVQMAPSDVANVRDVAWSPEYELEIDTGFQTSWGEERNTQVDFDASAVLNIMH